MVWQEYGQLYALIRYVIKRVCSVYGVIVSCILGILLHMASELLYVLQCTALHHAVMLESNLEVVQCLVEKGADVNSEDAAEVR